MVQSETLQCLSTSTQVIGQVYAYGVQEGAAVEEKVNFYSILGEEITLSLVSGNILCIAMDANTKLGKNYIRGDTIIFKSLLLQNEIQICFVELVHWSVNGAETKVIRE